MNQTGNEAEIATPSRRALNIKLIAGGLFLALAAFIVMNLPRGYSDDLSPIGKGKAAVVLIRDKNAVQSFDLMNVLNDVRDQYAGKVQFLLTDFDTPQGQAFIQSNHAARANLVLLDANGNLVKILSAPQTPASLQQEISALFEGKS